MKLRNIILALAVWAGFTSCVKDSLELPDGMTIFNATYSEAPQSKTVLSGLNPLWTPNDTISIYDGKNNMFMNTGTTVSAKTSFKGVLAGKGRKHYLAAYPYNEALTFSFMGMTVYSLNMPQEQTATVGSYDPSAALAVAYSETNELAFKNISSLIRFKIISDGVTSVTVIPNGENEILSGKLNVTLLDEQPRLTIIDGKQNVVLNGAFQKDSTYYITTLPTALNDGLTVLLNGDVKTFVADYPVNLTRSGIVDLGTLSLNPGTGDTDVEFAGKVYLKPNSNWLEADARFAVYFFEDDANIWVSMLESSVAGVYECDVPKGYSNMIYVRLNPSSTENSWADDVKWGQTADLQVPTDDKLCYVISAGSWDAGSWTTYPPAEIDPEPDPTPDPTPDSTIRTVYLNAGGSGLWDQAGAWFEVWSWQGSGEGRWFTMSSEGNGIYKVEVPATNEKIIFVRRGPDMSQGWTESVNYWNKTDDLVIPDGMNCYTITGWGGQDGSWSVK